MEVSPQSKAQILALMIGTVLTALMILTRYMGQADNALGSGPAAEQPTTEQLFDSARPPRSMPR